MIKEYISASNDKSVLDKEALRAIEAEEDSVEHKEVNTITYEDESKRKILLEDVK